MTVEITCQHSPDTSRLIDGTDDAEQVADAIAFVIGGHTTIEQIPQAGDYAVVFEADDDAELNEVAAVRTVWRGKETTP